MVARANVCATGVEWRHLNLPNEDKLLGRGLYWALRRLIDPAGS